MALKLPKLFQPRRLQRVIRFAGMLNSHDNALINIRVPWRNSSSSTGVPTAPKNTPGPEWVDQGWKDDGTGLGDYPNYVEWSYQNRNPDIKYWDQQERRNYGEPLHLNDDVLNVWMPDDLTNHKYSYREMALHLGIALGLLGAVVWYSEYVYDAPSRNPAVPKLYPYNNLYIELGGDPEKDPTETDLTRKIPRPHFGW